MKNFENGQNKNNILKKIRNWIILEGIKNWITLRTVKICTYSFENGWTLKNFENSQNMYLSTYLWKDLSVKEFWKPLKKKRAQYVWSRYRTNHNKSRKIHWIPFHVSDLKFQMRMRRLLLIFWGRERYIEHKKWKPAKFEHNSFDVFGFKITNGRGAVI